MTLTGTTVSGNHANGGAGIDNNLRATVTDSTISGNTVGLDGGGIRNLGGLTLSNSTVSGNTSTDRGGGIANSNTATLINSTVSDNSEDTGGGGIDNTGNGLTTGTVTLSNTIVAGNTLTSTSPTGGPDCSGTLTSDDYNLVQDTTDCTLAGTTTNTITGQDPLLGPLANNGGPTQTQALLAGSPALGAGDEATCTAAPVNGLDQRGYTRPTSCSIGAWDNGLLAQTITFTSTPPQPALYGGTYVPSARGGGSGIPVRFSIDAASTTGACSFSAGTVSFTGVGTCIVDANQAGFLVYALAPQVQQTFTIDPAPQTITFASTPPSPARAGATYTVSATGGASGNPVTFTAGPSSVCTSGGTNGATIALVGAGMCTVTANQAGSSNYSAADPVQQSFTVTYPPLYLALSVTSSPAGPVTTGSVVTAASTLGNHGTATEHVTLTATLTYVSPAGRHVTITSTRRGITLAPGQTLSQSASFTIQSSFPRGAYTITLTATDTAGDTAGASASLTVV